MPLPIRKMGPVDRPCVNQKRPGVFNGVAGGREQAMPDLQTDRLSISFRDTGPRHGKTVLLLHGWPDDSSTWDAVAEKLNMGGLRTVMPNLRGFGDTRFLSDSTRRTGNSGVLAMDAIALLDGLGIETVFRGRP